MNVKLPMNKQRGFIQIAFFIPIILNVALLGGIGNFVIKANPNQETVPEKIDSDIQYEGSNSLYKYEQDVDSTNIPQKPFKDDREEYHGPIRHIFSHSLIIYPEKALSDVKNISGYKDNMLTVAQFKQVIEQLYENNFILIDSRVLYSFDNKGNIHQNKLYLPKAKKPVILSIDDLSYYSYMKNGGFANKLVLDDDIVKTKIITPDGNTIITDDGDIVPIVDAFVKEHPDFSLDGAKGIIGLTGFEGVLGYRTNWKGERGDIERQNATIVANALKNSGWIFANHSFSHKQVFLDKTISKEFLANDISLWIKQVKPIIGKTDIFIGPFGEVFSESDPRRKQLIDAGFKILYGVGMDNYMNYFSNYFVMNRINIDGYRLRNNPTKLYQIFGIKVAADF